MAAQGCAEEESQPCSTETASGGLRAAAGKQHVHPADGDKALGKGAPTAYKRMFPFKRLPAARLLPDDGQLDA